MANQNSNIKIFKKDLFPNILDFLFYILIVSVPLLIPVFRFYGEKIVIPDLLFLVLSFFWVLSVFLKKKKIKWHTVYWVLVFYFLTMLISAIFSENVPRSFVKLLGIIYLIGLTVITHQFVDNNFRLEKFCKIWLIGTSFVIFIGIITIAVFYISPQNPFLDLTTSHYGAVPVGNYPRILSTFYSSSLFCNYLILSLGILFICERCGWIKNWVFQVLLFGILLNAIFTFSSGLGAVALILGFWIWFVFKKKYYFISKLFLFGGIFSAILFFIMNFIALETYRDVPYRVKIPLLEQVIYPSSRLLVWTESFKTFVQNPFTGVGIGLPCCEVYFQNTDGTTSVLIDAHNIYLSLASQAGLIGLIALLVLIYFLLRELVPLEKERKVKVIKISLTISLISGFIYQGLFGSFEDARHIWVLFGLILSVRCLMKKD